MVDCWLMVTCCKHAEVTGVLWKYLVIFGVFAWGEQEKTWSPQAETPHGRKYQQDWDILLTKLLKPPACNPAAKAAAKTAAKTAAEAVAEAAAKVMPKEKDLWTNGWLLIVGSAFLPEATKSFPAGAGKDLVASGKNASRAKIPSGLGYSFD
jgi:hypothetical protein